MPSQELPPLDVWYEMQVLARLRLRVPDENANPTQDTYDEQLNDLLESEVMAWNWAIEQQAELAELDENAVFEAPPAYLLGELGAVSDRIRGLERYRDRLIAFARSWAVDPESMRVIGTATGLSHTTIMRIADETAVRSVAWPARQIAEAMLEWLNPREEPALYARLSKIAADTRQATQP